MTDAKKHWESVYANKDIAQVSWYQAQSTYSLTLIRHFAEDMADKIADVGSGASVLIDELGLADK